jgi:hypothetical protein
VEAMTYDLKNSIENSVMQVSESVDFLKRYLPANKPAEKKKPKTRCDSAWMKKYLPKGHPVLAKESPRRARPIWATSQMISKAIKVMIDRVISFY